LFGSSNVLETCEAEDISDLDDCTLDPTGKWVITEWFKRKTRSANNRIRKRCLSPAINNWKSWRNVTFWPSVGKLLTVTINDDSSSFEHSPMKWEEEMHIKAWNFSYGRKKRWNQWWIRKVVEIDEIRLSLNIFHLRKWDN
jgi:hypothetical protein